MAGRLLAASARYLRASIMDHIRRSLLILALICGANAFTQPPASFNQKDAQGRKQGPWERTWANSQQLRYKGQFKDDKPVGTFTYFGTTGKVESIIAHYPGSDAAHGRHFHPNGKVMGEGRYDGQEKDSTWNYYDPDGNLRSTELWKNGTKNGEQLMYFANGKPAERCTWSNGKRNGPCQQFYDNGNVRTSSTYRNDVPDGVTTTYYDGGKKELEGRFANGEREGAWIQYNEDGSVQIQMLYAKGEFVKDKKENGTFKEYYPDDQVKTEVSWKDGKKESHFAEYFDNGHWKVQPAKLGPDGAETSQEERVLEDQTKKREGTYANDVLEGDVKEWDEKGKLISTTHYIGGKPVTP